MAMVGLPGSHRQGYRIWGTAFRRFRAEAPKWAAKLPSKATGLNAQVRQLIMVHASTQQKWQNSLGGKQLLHHDSRRGWGRIPKLPLGPLDLQGISLA